MKWILDRLKERSTWLGIIAFITSTGVVIKPELGDAIAAAGVAIAALVAVITADNK